MQQYKALHTSFLVYLPPVTAKVQIKSVTALPREQIQLRVCVN